MDTAMVILAAAVAGLIVGPVLGIGVDRIVERLAWAPEHRCVHCRAGQGAASLRPVVSWVSRCRSCGCHPGLRYPMVDVATAASFAAVAARFGLDWRLGPYLGLAAVLVILSAIDLETHLLPNVVVWPSILTGLFAVLVLSGEFADGAGIDAALIGAAVYGGFVGLAHIVYEPGMGRGDVKLALLLGLFIGWVAPTRIDAVQLVLRSFVLGLISVAVIGIGFNALRRRSLRAEVPAGPALAAAALVVVVVSPALVRG
ncbi:MAG: prepilin peptidase [Acidimicrobiales bacterium]